MDCQSSMQYVCELQENVEFHAKKYSKNQREKVFYSKFKDDGLFFVNQNGKRIIDQNGLWVFDDANMSTSFDSLTNLNEGIKFTKV